MKASKFLIIFLFSIAILGCRSSAKKTEKLIEKGQYEKAFDFSHEKYSKAKSSDRQKLAPLLVKSYEKGLQVNTAKVKQLKLGDLMLNSKEIYFNYKEMADNQLKMELLQPIMSGGKTLSFTQKDYTETLANAKENFVKFSYAKGLENYNKSTIQGYRRAYWFFADVNSVQPNYEKTSFLTSRSKELGMLKIQVAFFNNSFQALPMDLELDLRGFSNYGFPDEWTYYFFANEGSVVSPDYYIDIYLNSFSTNQGQFESEVFTRSKEVSAGYEAVYKDGKPMTDEKGNVLKREIFKIVTAFVTKTTREERSILDAELRLRSNNNLVESRRINPSVYESKSDYSFTGDKRALTLDDEQNIERTLRQNQSNSDIHQRLSEKLLRDMNGIFSRHQGLGLDMVRK